MSHNAHLRKQFKSIIIMLIKGRKTNYLLNKNWIVPKNYVHLNKLESPRQCIFTISWLSPVGKGRGPSFGQTWIIFTQGCFVPSLVENGWVVLEKKVKMWKVYDNNNNNTDDNNNDDNDGQILMREVHLSLRLPFLVSTWATFVSCTVTQWQDLCLHWYFSSDA